MEAAMLLRPLLPDHRWLALEEVRLTEEGVTVLVSSTSPSSQCPLCCQSSQRVPSRYERNLAVLDYDKDGDWDVLSAVGPLSKRPKNTYLFENLSGRGKKPTSWKEHILLSGHPCHEALAGDVDRDGDIDLVIKGWRSGSFLYLENRVAGRHSD
jgi:hypothetical protein